MKFALFFFNLFFLLAAQAQDTSTAAGKEAAYTRAITARAEKIVASLFLAEEAKKASVTSLIASQYRTLNGVYTIRDQKLKAAKESITDKQTLATETKAIEDAAAPEIEAAHDQFIKNLSAHLSEEQITKIKDGLTYNVLPITYKAFGDMIPSLKPAERDRIMAWLVEAREYAMSAESADKKHWWFGKYKGKINNYLAAQGYDLQKERRGWEERQKTAAAQKR